MDVYLFFVPRNTNCKLIRVTRMLIFLYSLLVISCYNLCHSLEASSLSSISCRTESGSKVSFHQYSLETCGKCYYYMPDWAFKPNSRYSYVGFGIFYDFRNNATYFSNETLPLASTFLSTTMAEKWQRCCLDAIDCCLHHLRDSPATSTSSPPSAAPFISLVTGSPVIEESSPSSSCPRTWDGWTCWADDVPSGETVHQMCPDHIYWKITAPPCRGYVTKTCSSGGLWYKKDGREWSNYTNCARADIYVRRLQYSIITNLISVSFIIPALVIFNCYRQLSQSPRIRLHKHLFTSLLIYAILSSLLKINLLVNQEEGDSVAPPSLTTQSLDTYCLILSLSLRYFRSSTYLCMFNEAFYLYQLIKKAFTAPSITPLIMLAYGVPFIMTGSYIIARLFIHTSLPSLVVIQTQASPSSSSSSSLTIIMSERIMATSLLPVNGSNMTTSSWRSTVSSLSSSATASSLIANVNAATVTSGIQSNIDDDPCWMLPARDAWKEWIINGPNLCMLMINSILILPIVREIYKKATSMPSPSPYGLQQQKQQHPTARLQHSDSRLSTRSELPPLPSSPKDLHHPQLLHNNSLKLKGDALPSQPEEQQTKRKSLLMFHLQSKSQEKSNGNPDDNLNSLPTDKNPSVTPVSGRDADKSLIDSRVESPISGNTSNRIVSSQAHFKTASLSKASFLVSLRAATLLLPLYGLHYLVIVYRPDVDICWLSELYHYLSLTLDGLQGCLVSILFCFGNNEVRQLLKRSLLAKREANLYMTEVVPVPGRASKDPSPRHPPLLRDGSANKDF